MHTGLHLVSCNFLHKTYALLLESSCSLPYLCEDGALTLRFVHSPYTQSVSLKVLLTRINDKTAELTMQLKSSIYM